MSRDTGAPAGAPSPGSAPTPVAAEDQLVITYRGRVVVTTRQAARARHIEEGSMRSLIRHRRAAGRLTELPMLDARTPVYYPEELT